MANIKINDLQELSVTKLSEDELSTVSGGIDLVVPCANFPPSIVGAGCVARYPSPFDSISVSVWEIKIA